MSAKKWRQLAEDKAEVEEQGQQIRQKFRVNRINRSLASFGEQNFSNQSQNGWIRRQKSLNRRPKSPAQTTKWMGSGQTLKHQHYHRWNTKAVMMKIFRPRLRWRRPPHAKRGGSRRRQAFSKTPVNRLTCRRAIGSSHNMKLIPTTE